MKNKKIILLLIVAAAAGYYFWGKKSAPEVKTAPVGVKVAPVVQKDMPVTVKQVGTVVANQTVAVRSRLDSQIMEVTFRDGDYVHAGDVLFLLDDRELQAQAHQQQANLTNLKAQYDRALALIKKDYVSRADLDQAKAAYEAQKAQLDSITTQLQYMRITAPIDGRTGTINVTVGNNVKANDVPLVTINQIKPILVQTSLPQQYVERLRSSMNAGDVPVTAIHEGSEGVSQGKMQYIDNNIDLASGTFAARASFPNENEALWPGMFVNVEVQLGLQQNAVVIPEVAIQHGQNGDYVFTIQDNKAHKQSVKYDRSQGGEAVIAEGLQPGQTVAVDGILTLKDGSDVTINTDTPKGADTPKLDAPKTDAAPAKP